MNVPGGWPAVPPRRGKLTGFVSRRLHAGTLQPGNQPAPPCAGISPVASDGGIFSFGQDFCGSTGGVALNKPVVGHGHGARPGNYPGSCASDGGVFSYGDAGFYGSTGSLVLNKPVVGMAATPDGKGYWLVASDGGIFSFGDAQFYGSAASVPNQSIVGMAASPDGQGYWEVTTAGRVFSFGDAIFAGDTSHLHLGWLHRRHGRRPGLRRLPGPIGSDGGVFSFGAPFFGSTGGIVLNRPVMAHAGDRGPGRLLVSWPPNGGIFWHYGGAPFRRLDGQPASEPANGRNERLLVRPDRLRVSGCSAAEEGPAGRTKPGPASTVRRRRPGASAPPALRSPSSPLTRPRTTWVSSTPPSRRHSRSAARGPTSATSPGTTPSTCPTAPSCPEPGTSGATSPPTWAASTWPAGGSSSSGRRPGT